MQMQPFKLERYFARHEFSAPYLLCCSDCEAMSVGDLLRLEPDADAGLNDLWLGYTESLGHPVLRQEIANLYRGISADQVLVHAGAEEAIFNTMNALLQPGDHVIVHYPCYQSLAEVALSIGCDLTYWKLENDPDWKLDFDFLESQLTAKTKLLIINCPHNPTGYQISRDEFSRLTELTRQHGIYLFSDEVYRFLEYDETDRLPSVCETYEKGLALGVMSKSFGLAGLRIGWLVVKDQTLFQKIAAYKDYTTICNSAPSEYLSIVALRQKHQLFSRNLGLISENLKALHSFFVRYSHLFSWSPPKAGPIAFPRLKVGDVAEFCQNLVDKAGVLLLPGTLYDDSYNNFRIGFGRAAFQEGLARMEEYLVSERMAD